MLIVISHPEKRNNESFFINQLFDAGLELCHLRKPNFSLDDYKKLIESIDIKYHHKLVLHHHHSLADEFKINRIHFSEFNRLKQQNFNSFQDFILSTSVHSIADFNTLSSNFEYAFLSPVFESISKQRYISTLNLLEEVKKRTNFHSHLIALGGITPENKHVALEKGYDGVALLGAIWNSNQPLKNYKKCLTVHSF